MRLLFIKNNWKEYLKQAGKLVGLLMQKHLDELEMFSANTEIKQESTT